MIINTMFLLMAEFEKVNIPLSDVAKKYLGMRPSTAAHKAAEGKLPIATFRIGNPQKAPRLVHVQDLADHIDKQRKYAKEELDRRK